MSTPMRHGPAAEWAPELTRRSLLKGCARAGAVFAMLPRAIRAELAAGPAAARIVPPVVWFYMDRLYIDITGSAIPYVSPPGMRSAAPLAHLSDEAFRRAQLYV
jgi:hypothetical protein